VVVAPSPNSIELESRIFREWDCFLDHGNHLLRLLGKLPNRSDGRLDPNFQWHSGLSAGWGQFFESVAIQRLASSSVAKFPTCDTRPYPVFTATIQRPSLIIFEWNFGFSLIQGIRAYSGMVRSRRERPALLGEGCSVDRAGRGELGASGPRTKRVRRCGFPRPLNSFTRS
jgi:hypothetical protein